MMLKSLLIGSLLRPILGDYACKNHPLDLEWPSLDHWNALNESINGALIKANPVASSSFANSSFASAINCDTVQERWFESAFQAEQPEAIGYPYWANNSCVSPNDYGYKHGQQCELGGLPSHIVNATTAEQIAIATKWASSRGMRIVVKGTGHDLNGR